MQEPHQPRHSPRATRQKASYHQTPRSHHQRRPHPNGDVVRVESDNRADEGRSEVDHGEEEGADRGDFEGGGGWWEGGVGRLKEVFLEDTEGEC